MKRSIFFILIIFIFVNMNAFSQEEINPSGRSIQLNLGFSVIDQPSLTGYSSKDREILLIGNLAFGYSLTINLNSKMDFSLGGGISKDASNGIDWDASLAIEYIYYLTRNISHFFPYIGVGALSSYTKDGFYYDAGYKVKTDEIDASLFSGIGFDYYINKYIKIIAQLDLYGELDTPLSKKEYYRLNYGIKFKDPRIGIVYMF